ncbi:UNVERIFIED_CONTAM: hypothetical protein H355_000822, partial [Colinus virginianus]
DFFIRLNQARFTEPLEDSHFHYRTNSAYLKKVVSYWKNQFNWKKQVEVLNKYPHFKTKIQGILLFSLRKKNSNTYSHLEGSRCCGLNDSPVGLAAYILEKFSVWTDPEFRNLQDGGLERLTAQVPTGIASFPNEIMHTPQA